MYYPSRCSYRTYRCRAAKLPVSWGGSLGPTMEICGILGLPILMVPCLHQTNGNIKRKRRAWKVQKCITLVGADTVLIGAGPQSNLFHGGVV